MSTQSANHENPKLLIKEMNKQIPGILTRGILLFRAFLKWNFPPYSSASRVKIRMVSTELRNKRGAGQ